MKKGLLIAFLLLAGFGLEVWPCAVRGSEELAAAGGVGGENSLALVPTARKKAAAAAASSELSSQSLVLYEPGKKIPLCFDKPWLPKVFLPAVPAAERPRLEQTPAGDEKISFTVKKIAGESISFDLIKAPGEQLYNLDVYNAAAYYFDMSPKDFKLLHQGNLFKNTSDSLPYKWVPEDMLLVQVPRARAEIE